MNRLNYRHFAPLAVILATLFLLGGCLQDKDKAEAKRKERLSREVFAVQEELLMSGQSDRAIAKLEKLNEKHPSQLEVIEALGNAYAEQGDHLMAAFYYDYAFELAPQRENFALLAATAHEKSGSKAEAAAAYRAYLRLNPKEISHWRTIALIEMELANHQPALSAYLELLRADKNQVDGQDRLNIATLYHRLGNNPQAVRWYEDLLTEQSLDAELRAQAMVGLFDLALRQKDWERALELMYALETLSPDTLRQGPYSDAYTELSDWDKRRKEAAAAQEKAAQEKAALEKAEQERIAREKAEKDKADSEKAATSDSPQTQADAVTQTSTAEQATAAEQAAAQGNDGDTGKTPAMKQTDSVTAQADTQATSTGAAQASAEKSTPTPTEETAAAAQDASAADLAAQGRKAFEDEDYATAAELLERSAKINPNNAEVLDMLSRASFRTGLYPQAERYAKLATYAEPKNVHYRLEYLRAYQRSNPPPAMLEQLISAKEDFPNDPNVTLALARGYEHIAGRKALAAELYHAFLKMSPTSPFAPDIRQKLLEWEM